LVGHHGCRSRMAESVILPDSATLQHIRFNLGVKGSLRRATPALDTNIEPTQISIEAIH